MKKLLILATIIACAGAVVFAAEDSKTLTVSATVSATAKLTLSAATLTFPDTDPDTGGGLISPTEGAITVTAKGKTSAAGNITLVVASDGDLISGTDSIPIGALRWTGAGAGYVAGPTTMTNADQSVGSWTGSGSYVGTNTFTLTNSWAYMTGNYGATLTYTLTAP